MKKFIAVVLSLALAVPVAAARCPPRIEFEFYEGIPQLQDGVDYEQLFASGLAGMGAMSRDGWQASLTVADEVLKILDNPTPGIPDPKWKRTVLPFVRMFAKAAETPAAYSYELLDKAIIAASRLKHDGAYFVGLFERAATDGSSAWITNVSNAGHLFEVIAAERWISTGVIRAEDVVAFGLRLGELEGDLVIKVPGGQHWFDFKGARGGASLEQIQKAERALTDGEIRRFSFAYETGTDPLAETGVSAAFQSANARLAALDPPRAIELVDAGPK